jgi:hypothetical protein
MRRGLSVRRACSPLVRIARVTLAVTVCLAGTTAASAAQGAGSGASTVLRIPPAPRPLALGNALVAVPDVWALEYNPAGAGTEAAVAFAYQGLPVGAMAGAAAVVAPLSRTVAFGLSARFVDYGEIDVIEADPGSPVGRPTGATATGGELTTLAAVSAGLGRVRWGVGGRWLRLDVAGLTDDAFAVDAGVSLAAAPALTLGAAVQSLGGDVRAGQPAPLPRTVRAGAAVRRPLGPLEGLLTVEARRREARSGVGAGLEVTGGAEAVRGTVRLGYESRAAAGDAYSRLVFGGGVRVDRVAVDLAYRALGPLGSTHQVSVAYRF